MDFSKVNWKRVFAVSFAVLTAVSIVTGQAAQFVQKAVSFFFGAQ